MREKQDADVRWQIAGFALIRLHARTELWHLEGIVAGHGHIAGDNAVDAPKRKLTVSFGDPRQIGGRLDEDRSHIAIASSLWPVAGAAILRVVIRAVGDHFGLLGHYGLNAHEKHTGRESQASQTIVILIAHRRVG